MHRTWIQVASIFILLAGLTTGVIAQTQPQPTPEPDPLPTECFSVLQCDEIMNSLESEINFITGPLGESIPDGEGLKKLSAIQKLQPQRETFAKDLQDHIDRADEGYYRLKDAKRKNMRKYKLIMDHVRTELIDPPDENRNPETIEFEEIEEGLAERFKRNFKKEPGKWTHTQQVGEYKNIINLFDVPLNRAVEELRSTLPNGGVLPGSREVGGTEYVKKRLLPGIINTMIVIILSASVLMIIIGGMMYIFSGGDPELTKKGTTIVLWTILGAILAILAYSVVRFAIGIDFSI